MRRMQSPAASASEADGVADGVLHRMREPWRDRTRGVPLCGAKVFTVAELTSREERITCPECKRLNAVEALARTLGR